MEEGGLSETKTTRREEILRRWNSYELTFEQRDALLSEIMADKELDLYPAIFNEMDEWESEAGLYPDVQDPRFAEKLMRKQEFAENKQISVKEQMEDGVNPCDPNKEFELTPVQRLCSLSLLEIFNPVFAGLFSTMRRSRFQQKMEWRIR